MATKKNLTVIFTDHGLNDLVVFADKKKLKQVILNIMSNAVKYNRENGSIEINCNRLGKYIEIDISDTGLGIPEERMSELFTVFGRLGRENSDIEGTGVGLVICKQLLELMGGDIRCESKVDEGSRFGISIPACEM
jgi:signal transduction histidine kinase